MCGGEAAGVFDGALQVIRYFFKMLEVELVGTVCHPGLVKEGGILRPLAAAEEARFYGRKPGEPKGGTGVDMQRKMRRLRARNSF